MEDEAGYMVLTPKLHDAMQFSQAKATQGIHTSSRWYKTTLGILGASCVILGLGVIVLSVFEEMITSSNATLYEGGNPECSLPECSPCFEDIITHLKHSLCDSLTGATRLPLLDCYRQTDTESTECKLCPMNWLLENEKCYWFSKETKNWLDAYDSCSRKNAHMIVFRDSEELNFTQKIRGMYRFWIGLNFTSAWKNGTWVDGSLLNQTLFPVAPPKDGDRCGVLRVNEILPEMCDDQFKWICAKDTVLIEHTTLKRVLF